jgi:hypothetical protein
MSPTPPRNPLKPSFRRNVEAIEILGISPPALFRTAHQGVADGVDPIR